MAAAGSPDAGSAGSVAAALKSLEAAQKNLTEAVHRIEKDPPSNADLEAAHVAVEGLKSAIDAGTVFEEQDLDYARAALGARKELRTQREFVEDRRAKVHIFDSRRKIDAAIASLDQATRRTTAKDAGPKDFDEAHAAAAALEKELKEGQPFAKQDAKFATYLSETEATLARQRKLVDDRWTELELDKHKVVFQQGRDALAAAVAPLATKGSTDAQFDAAERASTTLTKLLEQGKPFESRDKAYRADADKARAELAQAKKKMDEYVASVGLARLTADIEPARQSLVEAAKALHGKGPTPDQLTEAKTAAFVVRKLLDKSKTKAASSPAFAKYLDDTEKTLVEVEVQLQLRSLEAARKDLNQSLRALERRSATEENFQETTTALTILEKTLETVHSRDPALQKPVADSRALVVDAKATMAKRRYEVDLTKQHDKLRDALKTAEAAVKQIWEANAGEETLKQADAAVKALDPVLEEGKPFTHKDADYKEFDKKTRDRQKELSDRIAGRRVALAASIGRGKLNELILSAKGALDTAQKPESTDADLDAASKDVAAIQATIEANAKLEKQDKGYAAQAQRARDQLIHLTETLAFATDARSLRKLLAGSLSEGNAAVDGGSKSKDPNAQKQQFEKALHQFQACQNDGATTVKDKPALAKVVVLVDGSPNLPQDVIALCTKRAEATQPLVDGATAVAYFHNGAKRDFETAKTKLGQGDKAGAIAQFNECIADGRIFAQRYPKMSADKFEVAGASYTVNQLVDQCIKERNALGGK